MTNVKVQISKETTSSNDKKVFDLEERTSLFGESIIDFARSLAKDQITNVLVSQIVRSGTSVGANYMEADGAESRKDFYHKISICKKEAKETKHWLRMIARAKPEFKSECQRLWQEAHELVLIFSAIVLKKG